MMYFMRMKHIPVFIEVPLDIQGAPVEREALDLKQPFAVKGAFTFVLRLVNGKWLIKSQTWLQQKGVTGQ